MEFTDKEIDTIEAVLDYYVHEFWFRRKTDKSVRDAEELLSKIRSQNLED